MEDTWDSGLYEEIQPMYEGALARFKLRMKRAKLDSDFPSFLGQYGSFELEVKPNLTYILRGPWWLKHPDPLRVLGLRTPLVAPEWADAMLNIEIRCCNVTYPKIYVHRKGFKMWKGWEVSR